MEPGAITPSTPGTAGALLQSPGARGWQWRERAGDELHLADTHEFLTPLHRSHAAGAALPVITVITAVLNGARHLEQCIRSVCGQTYPHIEFIVIDGGSTDGSVDIIRRHAGSIAHWASEPDRGIYDALNKGLRASTGDWICVMGSDDFFPDPTVLATMAQTLVQCEPREKLVYGSVAMVDGDAEVCVIGRAWHESKPQMRESTPIPYAGLMHRRSWFEQYGLYDSSFRIAGDYEMLLRGWPHEDARYVPGLRTLVMRIGGVSNNSATAFASLREVRRARDIHRIRPPSFFKRRAFGHTVVRYLLQRAWAENVMWKLRRLRESLFAFTS